MISREQGAGFSPFFFVLSIILCNYASRYNHRQTNGGDFSRVRSIGCVGAAQLIDSPENCVRARHILHTVAATEVDT